MADKKAVLFVDNDKNILKQLDTVFKNKDYRLYFAKTVDEALDILIHNKVDVVAADMILPGKTGLDLLHTIKHKYPYIVRIFLVEINQISSILSCINNGAIYRFIEKPWKNSEQILLTIKDAMLYSDFLQNNIILDNNNSDIITISIESLRDIIDLYKRQYFIVKNDTLIVFVSSSFNSKMNVNSYLNEYDINLNLYHKRLLDHNYTLYIRRSQYI
ncbi:MAG: response regulator receiver protein [Clostridiaceae bacterium]|jgi:DNA-binding NtrC family response regulator|nr:response regulator receiver protein [Clostridiaceae bacterium]